ncbi:GTP-binding protein [Alternaria sp. BMP 0032]|nr:GTP-binding protein [Alternaria sp. BMP 0032]
MAPPPKQRKVAIVGSRAVGKSSLTVQFVDGHFVDSYYPTIENTFSKMIKYKNQDYATEIIDTAGQDEYSILNSKHFIGIHGYMIVYSVANKQSFEMARIIRDKILNHLAVEWVPLVIVGNKSDLRPEQRQVTPEDGKALAAEFKCAHTEASARYNENVQKAFELMIAEVERSQNPGEPAGGSKSRVPVGVDKYPALQKEREDKEKKRRNSAHLLKHPFDHLTNALKKK